MIKLWDEVLKPPVGLLQRIPLTQYRGDSFALRLGDGEKVDGGGGHGRRIAQSGVRCAPFSKPDSFCRSRAVGLQRLHFAPIQPGKQRLELRPVQHHHPVPNRRPDEGGFL